MVAHMNSTLGLVETGVGLVPGGGGCKKLLWRWVQTKMSMTMIKQLFK